MSGGDVSLEGLPRQGQDAPQDHDAGADEFMRRFLLHVLPGGFHRIRHYGLIANNARKEKLALARELLQVAPAAISLMLIPLMHTNDVVRRGLFLFALWCAYGDHPDADASARYSCASTGSGCVMSSRFNFKRSDRVPTLHQSQSVWIGFALWCQTGAFCSDRFRLFWRFGSGKHHLIYPGRRHVCIIKPRCGYSNPHSCVVHSNRHGTSRGFLPRGLYDACPQAWAESRRSVVAGWHPTNLNVCRRSPVTASRQANCESRG